MRSLCTLPFAAMAMKPEDEATLLALNTLALKQADEETLLAIKSSSQSVAMMQDFASRNVTHLEGLMQSMVVDSISGDGTASDDVQALLNNIKELLLGDIRGVLQDEHNLDQAAIYDLKSCFHDCKNSFNGDRRGDKELKARADAEQRNHESCRTEVHAAYVDKVKKCNSLDAFIESLVFPTGYKEKCEPLSTKMEDVFEEGIAWYTRNFESWRLLHETCVTAYHKYDALDTGCDMTQGAFETSTCAHVQSMWTSCNVNQKSCCARCTTSFHKEVSRVECAERDRKVDWSATEKIECYVDILLNSPTDAELAARCTDGESCLSKWRQSEFDKCNIVCAEVDFDYGDYRHVGNDNDARDDWQAGDTASEVNTTHRKDSNTIGEELASGAHQSHSGAVSWDGKALSGARCTRHLDIDFIQMPPCESCPPLPPTPCAGDFITKFYFEFDKTDRITALNTDKECSPDVHTKVWGYNRAVCRECGPLVGREVDVDEWSYFEVEIGKNTQHHGKKCVNLHYPVVCESNAGHPGIRVNTDWADAGDTFMITVEGADSKRVCAERTDSVTGHDVAIEGAEDTHYEQTNQIGFVWGMNLRIQCKSMSSQYNWIDDCQGWSVGTKHVVGGTCYLGAFTKNQHPKKTFTGLTAGCEYKMSAVIDTWASTDNERMDFTVNGETTNFGGRSGGSCNNGWAAYPYAFGVKVGSPGSSNRGWPDCWKSFSTNFIAPADGLANVQMHVAVDQHINDEAWGWHDMEIEQVSCPPPPPQTSWNLCIGARGDNFASIYLEEDVCVSNIHFTHTSGTVSCRKAASGDSNWGCDATSIGLVIADGGAVTAPVFDTVNGMTPHYSAHGHWYKMDGVSKHTDSMDWVFKEPIQLMAEEYKLWYNEDLSGGTEGDNRGEACYDVEMHTTESCNSLAPLQFDRVCASALGDVHGTIDLPQDTCVTEIDVHYMSGSVSCIGGGKASSGDSNFGCSTDLIGMVWTKGGKKDVIMPHQDQVEGLTKTGHSHAHWYKMHGVGKSTRTLPMKLKSGVAPLKVSGKLDLWYSEDLSGGTEADNTGTACYEVAVHRALSC